MMKIYANSNALVLRLFLTPVSLALLLAFHWWAWVSWVLEDLGRGLGFGIVSETHYLKVVDVALPYIKPMLDEMGDEAKENMKEIAPDHIGSDML